MRWQGSKLTTRGLKEGFAFTAVAYMLWGVLPLYWKMLQSVLPIHVLACRIVFSCVFVALILLMQKNTRVFSLIREHPFLVLLCGLTVSVNWGTFIFAVQTGRTVQASLGYCINPLVSIVLGLVSFKERLSVMQWVSVALAALGVAALTALAGDFPWIAFTLAFSFGAYGLFKKLLVAQTGTLASLAAETFVCIPIALLLALLPPRPIFSYLGALPPHVLAGLAASGPITAIPLYLFARGAKLLPLSLLGFVQFLLPMAQFALGVFVFGESFPLKNLIPYSLVWVAAILFALSFIKRRRA
jgi:chloramphenicol-sensitive protein RarD